MMVELLRVADLELIIMRPLDKVAFGWTEMWARVRSVAAQATTKKAKTCFILTLSLLIMFVKSFNYVR